MNKKYDLVEEEKYGKKLFRLVSLKDFANVKVGDLGGLVQNESNLSQDGDCWIGIHAYVTGNVKVSGDAQIYEKASVWGDVQVYGNAKIFGKSHICTSVESESDYCTMGTFGNCYRWITFHKGIVASDSGRFSGTVAEFKEAVGNLKPEYMDSKLYRAILLLEILDEEYKKWWA